MKDLISREKAYEVLTDYYHQRTEIQHKALREALDRVPDVDVSEILHKIAELGKQASNIFDELELLWLKVWCLGYDEREDCEDE